MATNPFGIFSDLVLNQPSPRSASFGIFDDLVRGPLKIAADVTATPTGRRPKLPAPPTMTIGRRPEGQNAPGTFDPSRTAAVLDALTGSKGPTTSKLNLAPTAEEMGEAFTMAFPVGATKDASLGAIKGISRAARALVPRPVRAIGVAGAGLGLAQSDNEQIAATGTGLMALAGLHAIGLPNIKAAGQFIGGRSAAKLAESATGQKALDFISPDIMTDPKVKALFNTYEETKALYKAKGAELSKAASQLGPKGDRIVSDIGGRESFESLPLTGDQSAAMAVAQRVVDQFSHQRAELLRVKELSPAGAAKFAGRYVGPQLYAEHLGEQVQKGTPAFVRGTSESLPRISSSFARQDLSDEARNALGEVRESSFRTAVGIERGYGKVATADLFNGLRELPGVVHPEFAKAIDALRVARLTDDKAVLAAAKDAVTGMSAQLAKEPGYTRLADTPGMGVLRGAVVRNDVAGYLNEVPQLLGKNSLFQWWKKAHTVLNPVTHVGNTMSNSVVAHLTGLPMTSQPKALAAALKDYNAYGPSTRYLAELGVLERGLPTFSEGVPIGGRKLSTALTELSATTRPETAKVLAEKGITPKSRSRVLAEKAANRVLSFGLTSDMATAYAKEDGVFRVATWSRLVADGMEPKAAADYVDRAFVNYKTRSPLLGVIKNTVSPFVMYPVKAIPFALGQIVEYPWRWATLAAAWGGLDQYSQRKVGAIAQRDLRPDQRTNRALGYLAPGFIQLPFAGKEGEKYAFNLSRWTPFSALTGSAAPGSTAFALGGSRVPGILQPSGPLVDIGARLANRDPFTGDKLIRAGDEAKDKAMVAIESALALATPSAVGFHAPRVAKDIIAGDLPAAAFDALGFLGARPNVVRPGMQSRMRLREYYDARNNIRADLRADLRATTSEDRKATLRQRASDKLARLMSKYKRDTSE